MNRREFFDIIAQDWDQEHQKSEEKEKLCRLFEHLPIVKGDRVLDAGCGTGRLAPFLHEAVGDKGVLVEADFSREMLKIGKGKYRKRMLYFIQADAQKIPLKEQIFDAVICFALFPHLPDKAQALMEFRRILKPNKPLIIAHLMSREELNRFHVQVKGPVTRDFLPSGKEMEALFFSAGYRKLTIKDEPSLYLAHGVA